MAGMNSAPIIREVVIVGSGPAGYTAGVYAGRAQLKPLLYEGSVTAGGALMNTTEVENFPGFPEGIMGPDLMSGNEVRAKAVILATGSAYREIGLENEKRLSGRGVSWCATCDGFFFRNQVIAVVGGGDSAMEEANFLTRFAEKVILVHRRDSLRASKIMADRAKANPKIEFLWNTEVIDVLGDEKVTGLKIKNTVDGTEGTLDVTGLFVALGHDPRSELLTGQVELDGEGYVIVGGAGRAGTATNLKGVFACGDLVDHTYRQAITAAGSGCAAALDAERFLAGH